MCVVDSLELESNRTCDARIAMNALLPFHRKILSFSRLKINACVSQGDTMVCTNGTFYHDITFVITHNKIQYKLFLDKTFITDAFNWHTYVQRSTSFAAN